MLTLTLRVGEWIKVGDAWIQFAQANGSIDKRILIRVKAPKEIPVLRMDLTTERPSTD